MLRKLKNWTCAFCGTMEECEYHIKNLEDHFLRCDVMALRQSKKLLTAVPKLSFEDARDYCIQALAERRKSPKVVDKISQFLNKKS